MATMKCGRGGFPGSLCSCLSVSNVSILLCLAKREVTLSLTFLVHLISVYKFLSWSFSVVLKLLVSLDHCSYLLVLLQAKADFQHSPIAGDTRGRITFK